jgi:aerobic carbon-monoxide dehydrogenase medium subunit
LIDISRIPGLNDICVVNGTLHIGALTRHVDIETSALVRQHLPLLAMAAPHIAHTAIRNRGTFGGSLAMADPAAEWPACCLALNATIIASSRGGTRRIAAPDFFHGLYETALKPDEILTSVEFSLPGRGSVAGFSELARRHGDYAMAGLAAQGVRKDGAWHALTLAFFGISDRTILATAAADALLAGQGIAAAAATITEALDVVADDTCSAETRLHLARVLLTRVVGEMEDSKAMAA